MALLLRCAPRVRPPPPGKADDCAVRAPPAPGPRPQPLLNLLSLAARAAAVVGGVRVASAGCQTALEGVPPPHWRGWPHDGPLSAFDCASLRRGFEVYRQVCSACHSLQYLPFRRLVGVTHTAQQAVALARSVVVPDGPDEEGRLHERPGGLSDAFPPPYPNEEFARFANNGALPPDLTLIVNVRQQPNSSAYAQRNARRDALTCVLMCPTAMRCVARVRRVTGTRTTCSLC